MNAQSLLLLSLVLLAALGTALWLIRHRRRRGGCAHCPEERCKLRNLLRGRRR